jgi:tetratricopeptide (TPR) repeat protein
MFDVVILCSALVIVSAVVLAHTVRHTAIWLGGIVLLVALLWLECCTITLWTQQVKPAQTPQQKVPQTPSTAASLPEEARKAVAAKVSKADFRGAVKELNTFLARNPANLAALMLRAEMYIQLFSTLDAIKDYSRIIELEPTSKAACQAYMSRAQLRLERQQDMAGALDDYTALLRIDTTNALVYFLRGSIYEQQGMFDSASADFTKALSVGVPNNPLALTRRGFCALSLGNNEDAMRDFSAAIAATTAPPFDAFFYRASLYLRQRKFSEALFDFDAALRLNEQSPEAYYMRGYAKLSLGRTEDGCADLAQAQALKFEPSVKLIAEYCGDIGNLDSLRRFTMPAITVTAQRSREEIAIKDSRRMLDRISSILPNQQVFQQMTYTSLTGLENVRLLPPGVMSVFECNKNLLEFTRPSQINVFCVVQILQEELRYINDATTKSLGNQIFTLAQELFVVESEAQLGGDATAANTQSQILRIQLSEQMRELSKHLRNMQERQAASPSTKSENK